MFEEDGAFKDIPQEILEGAQKIFQKLTPQLCVDKHGKRDPYYLDHPERSHTMTAYIKGALWGLEKAKNEIPT
jgi:hypothetical protein